MNEELISVREELGASLLVVGSAHLVVLSEVQKLNENPIEQIATTKLEVGGCGAHLAINFQSLGIKTKLLTELKANSLYSEMIMTTLKEYEVEGIYQEKIQAEEAVFNMVFSPDNTILAAAGSYPVMTARFEYQTVLEAVRECRGVLIDCSIAPEMIKLICRIATTQGVPFFLTNFPARQKGALVGLTDFPECIWVTPEERTRLTSELNIDNHITALSTKFNCFVVEMDPEKGIIWATPEGENTHQEELVYPKADNCYAQWCAQDAFISVTVADYFYAHHELKKSLGIGCLAAQEVLQQPHGHLGSKSNAVQPDLTGDDFDEVTGLWSRIGAKRKITELEYQAKAYGMIWFHIEVPSEEISSMLDINFGLKQVASSVKEVLRGGDFCARWELQDFVCVIQEIDTEEKMNKTLERFKKSVAAILAREESHVKVMWGGAIRNPQLMVEETIEAAQKSCYHDIETELNFV